ncbi:MAG: hypothetical protein WCJ56_00560 [bacterium]
MGEVPDRWDPSLPLFVVDVQRLMVIIWPVVSLVGVIFFRPQALGILMGGLIAVILFASAMRAGKVLIENSNYNSVMFRLIGSQFIIWVGMAFLLVRFKIDGPGFVIGVSILPVAILMTLTWYLIKGASGRSE